MGARARNKMKGKTYRVMSKMDVSLFVIHKDAIRVYGGIQEACFMAWLFELDKIRQKRALPYVTSPKYKILEKEARRGWFVSLAEHCQESTCLSPKQQNRISTHLCGLGVVERKLAGFPRVSLFRINFNRINKLMGPAGKNFL